MSLKRKPSFGTVPFWFNQNLSTTARLPMLGEIAPDGHPTPPGKRDVEVPFATQCHRCFAEQGRRGTCEKCLNEMRERAELEMEVALPKP